MKLKSDYRQFKLANGEEILCEVMQWGDEDVSAIVIRKAMKIYQVDRLDGYRMYTLRPWMIYSEDPSQLMTINDQMIIGETTPAKPLFKQYMMVVREHKKSFDEELKGDKGETNLVDQMTDEQLGQMIRDIANDSDSNVVDLFSVDKSKMH
tara:strand:- start:659 stop:1111 length:453 start_codon:yes stop_codon:yes gene_type:complete